ncbi:hypothetical protein CAPTEDRAFT_189321 [Capitella teleta]|uniref:G-protein coupled receptors family 1 profile domain-containing protein n=1 Tax=Capitella teleta TaxID=283909 RepID=R7UJF9_CAPTE|nr:hypothetical protein CAPTEDRAFT_189321 [Capitella teleta]|eukprot:ELU06689.1 hypothetical protein CAPTEDRAFT_189321 [Capitella teleta]
MGCNTTLNVSCHEGICADTLHGYLNPMFRIYVHPALYVFGIPGNLLSLGIWMQKEMRNSTSHYFSALAMSDTVVLCLHSVFTIQTATGWNIISNTGLCEGFHALYLSMESLSGFLILGLTVDRFVIINYPLRRFKIQARARALKTIIALFVLSLVIGVLEGLMWSYDRTSASCTIRSLIPTDSGIFLKIWYIVLLCVGIVFPMLIIIVLNVIIARALLLVSKRRNRLWFDSDEHSSDQADHSSAEPRLHKSDMDGTLILLCLSMYLVVSECPDGIVYLLRPFFLPQGSSVDTFCTYSTVALCLETFALTNYASNVLIYSLAGRRFRNCVRKHIHIPLNRL